MLSGRDHVRSALPASAFFRAVRNGPVSSSCAVAAACLVGARASWGDKRESPKKRPFHALGTGINSTQMLSGPMPPSCAGPYIKKIYSCRARYPDYTMVATANAQHACG